MGLRNGTVFPKAGSVHTGANERVPVFDISTAGHDKFLHAVLYQNDRNCIDNPECEVFKQCKQQSKFDFGFVPLTDTVMPSVVEIKCFNSNSIAELHQRVKSFGCHNYLGTHIPIKSQLNIDIWEE